MGEKWAHAPVYCALAQVHHNPVWQRETLIEWRLEYLSLAPDPPQPMVTD